MVPAFITPGDSSRALPSANFAGGSLAPRGQGAQSKSHGAIKTDQTSGAGRALGTKCPGQKKTQTRKRSILLAKSRVRDAVVRLRELEAQLLRAGGHVRGRDEDAHDVVAAAAAATLSTAGGPHDGGHVHGHGPGRL